MLLFGTILSRVNQIEDDQPTTLPVLKFAALSCSRNHFEISSIDTKLDDVQTTGVVKYPAPPALFAMIGRVTRILIAPGKRISLSISSPGCCKVT